MRCKSCGKEYIAGCQGFPRTVPLRVLSQMPEDWKRAECPQWRIDLPAEAFGFKPVEAAQ